MDALIGSTAYAVSSGHTLIIALQSGGRQGDSLEGWAVYRVNQGVISMADKSIYGYTLRDRYGQVVHIGQTNNPRARRAEHRLEEKEFYTLRTERGGMTKEQADKWERDWLEGYRKPHGRNPRYSRTMDGQPTGKIYERGESKPSKRSRRPRVQEVEVMVAVPEIGYCLRCGKEIVFNPQRPYCTTDFRTWGRFKNTEYEEQFCHSCGDEHVTSMPKPMCRSCYRSNRAFVA